MTNTDTTTPPASADDGPSKASATYADLLGLQRMLDVIAGFHSAGAAESNSPSESDGDMVLFRTSHLICEAAFAMILQQMEEARDHLVHDDTTPALRRLQLLPPLMHTPIQQIDVLIQLSPTAFENIRTRLGDASGIQSVQWRQIEYLAGLRDRRWINTKGFTSANKAQLRRRLQEPSLADAFTELTRGHRGAPGSGPPGTAAVRDALVRFDDTVTLWRARHAILAAHFLGDQSGTAGTAGAAYLWSQASGTRLFPDLPTSSTS